MFKKEERKPKEYKGTTIYLTKYEDKTVEEYLAIIVSCVEAYVKQKGVMPEKLKLGYNNYSRILEHNKSLIEKKGDKYYTFGVEIEVWKK